MKKENLSPQTGVEKEEVKEVFKFNSAEKNLMDVSERLAQINTKLQNNPGAREAAKLRRDQIRLKQEQKKFWKEEVPQPEKVRLIKKEDPKIKKSLIDSLKTNIKKSFIKNENDAILVEPELVAQNTHKDPLIIKKSLKEKISAFLNFGSKKNIDSKEGLVYGPEEKNKDEVKTETTPEFTENTIPEITVIDAETKPEDTESEPIVETEEKKSEETPEVISKPVTKNQSKNRINFMAQAGSFPFLNKEIENTPEKNEKEVTPTAEQEKENDINKSKTLLKKRLEEKEKSIASISDLVLLAGDIYLHEDPELQKFAFELWSSDKVIKELGNGSENMDDEKIKEVIDRISTICGNKKLFIKEIKKLKEKSEKIPETNTEGKKDIKRVNYLAQAGSYPFLNNENEGLNITPENKDVKKETWWEEELKKPIVGAVEDTAQKPENQKVVIENKDKGKEEGEITPDNVEDFLSPSNKGFFSKMSQGAKSFMSSLYKGINKIPVVNRLVAKVEIAYNQKWIDVKEEKSVNLKGKMDELSQKIGQFEGAKQKMMARAEKLRVNGDPSYASVLLEAQRIERRQIKMANAKDTLQSRIESRENAIKLYANKRDAIADRMIENYDKKLSPIEAKLQKNEGYRDRLNLFIAGKEAEHESKLEEFKNLRKDMDEYVADAKDGGTSERRALRSKFIKDRKKEIEDGIKKIEHEKIQMEEEKLKVNNKIAKIDDKANPYRDRRNEFVRVKANRPIKIDLEERVNLINNQTTENTASHTRNDQAYSGYASYYPDTENSNNESNDRQKLVNLIPEYNEFVKKESKDVEMLINEKDLFKIISKEVTVLTKEKLLGILKNYYKMKKVPESKYLPLLAKIK